jgi:hypothetical protein
LGEVTSSTAAAVQVQTFDIDVVYIVAVTESQPLLLKLDQNIYNNIRDADANVSNEELCKVYHVPEKQLTTELRESDAATHPIIHLQKRDQMGSTLQTDVLPLSKPADQG